MTATCPGCQHPAHVGRCGKRRPWWVRWFNTGLEGGCACIARTVR